MTFANQDGVMTRLELTPRPRFRRQMTSDERRAARATVLRLAQDAEGWTTHELAQMLKLSVRTVQSELAYARKVAAAARACKAAADD